MRLRRKLRPINLLFFSFFCSLFTTIGEANAKPKKGGSQFHAPKYSAIVMDAETGKILEQEDSHGVRHPASLTKMMTLYLTFEALKNGRLKLNTQLAVSAKASRQIPTKLGLRPGETISVSDAIMGLITKSANDASVALAEHLAGSEEAFARRMTQKARALGMTNTVFKNASGVPNPAQITTAYDMAILSRALYRDYPKQYGYFKHKSFSHRGVAHRNHNHLLGKVHGVDGIKTGFTCASGFNLAASAVRYDVAQQPHRLIAVVLGGPNRHWRDRRVTELLEVNFERMGISKGTSGPAKITDLVMRLEQAADNDNDEDAFLEAVAEEYAAAEKVEETSSVQATVIPTNLQKSPSLNDIIETAVAYEAPRESVTPKVVTTNTKAKPANWVVPTATTTSQTKVKPKPTKLYIAQIGTYRSMKEARKKANQAKSKIAAGEVNITQVLKGKKHMMAVQISNLSQDQAKKLCKAWQTQGQQCSVLG